VFSDEIYVRVNCMWRGTTVLSVRIHEPSCWPDGLYGISRRRRSSPWAAADRPRQTALSQQVVYQASHRTV